MDELRFIRINKNRGWRGLAELECFVAGDDKVNSMVFSFSQAIWDDMLNGRIVTQDENYYYVITFDNLPKLPRKDQQRSVLIKNFSANVIEVNRYEKSSWMEASGKDWQGIYHFVKNRNNHTQSDWNYIRSKSDA